MAAIGSIVAVAETIEAGSRAGGRGRRDGLWLLPHEAVFIGASARRAAFQTAATGRILAIAFQFPRATLGAGNCSPATFARARRFALRLGVSRLRVGIRCRVGVAVAGLVLVLVHHRRHCEGSARQLDVAPGLKGVEEASRNTSNEKSN